MKPTRGTCQRCKVEQDVVDGKVVLHTRATGWTSGGGRPSTETHWMRCNGSGRPSVEASTAARDRRLAALQRKVDSHRGIAAVTLDAVLEGRHDMDANLAECLRLALVDYRLRYPTSKGRVLWVTAPRRQIHMRFARYRNSHDRDVYCVFCGALVLANLSQEAVEFLRACDKSNASLLGPAFVDDRVSRHTTPCALQCLAGMRVPVAPGTRRIPEELRREEEQRA